MKPKHILITRPKEFSSSLATKLEQNNFVAHKLPLIETVSISSDTQQQLIDKLCLLIFTSKPAVTNFIKYYKIPNTIIYTVGKGTHDLITKYTTQKVMYPKNGIYNSENLWKEIKNLPLNGNLIGIVKGDEGRKYLQNKIKTKGATANEINVYKRILPNNTQKNLENLLKQTKIDIIIITCMTSLHNLLKVSRPIINICDIPICVISERLHKAAIELGFCFILVAKSVQDEHILKAIIGSVIYL